MPRVIVSSGHTAANPGSIANGLREADVARNIAKATLKYLRQNGIISLAIPPGMELLQRIEWINKSGYNRNTNDLALEIHINDGGRSGVEVWYEGDGNNPSQRLADLLLDTVTQETRLLRQGSRSEFQHELGSISFLHEVLPIACLIECGYIDNEDDAKFLREPNNIDLTGKSIAKGVLKYYGLEFRELPGAVPATAVSPGQATVPQAPAAAGQSQVSSQPAATPASAVPQTRPVPSVPPTQTYNPNNSSNFTGNAYSSSYGNTGGYNTGSYPGTYPGSAPAAGYAAPGYNSGAGGGPPSAFPPMPSREERKEMIKKNYIKILGREPNTNDLNYFLNIGIREEELLKKMMDSQEHADLVKARQEVITAKKQLTEQQAELEQLRALTTDQNRIINNLNASIQQKNSAIGQLQQKINGMLQRLNEKYSNRQAKKSGEKIYKGNFLDRLFKAFSDIFE